MRILNWPRKKIKQCNLVHRMRLDEPFLLGDGPELVWLESLGPTLTARKDNFNTTKDTLKRRCFPFDANWVLS